MPSMHRRPQMMVLEAVSVAVEEEVEGLQAWKMPSRTLFASITLMNEPRRCLEVARHLCRRRYSNVVIS